MSLTAKIQKAIQEAPSFSQVKVIHNGASYTNFTMRDGKPVAWRRDLITGKARFVNV